MTQAENAIKRWLIDADLDGLKHLKACCLKACRGLYFPGSGPYPHEERRDWIEVWLLEYLRQYRGVPKSELTRITEARTFRYVPKLCKQAFVDEMRRRSAKKRLPAKSYSLNTPILNSDEEESSDEYLDFLYQTPGHPVASMGASPSCESNRLVDLGGYIELSEDRLKVALLEMLKGFPDASSARMDRRIADRLNVGARTARTLRARIQQEMAGKFFRPDVKALREYLESPGSRLVGYNASNEYAQ